MTLTGDAAMCLRVMCRAIRMKRNWFSARTSALAKRVFSGFGPITITDDDLDRPERAFDKSLNLNLYRHRAGSAGVLAWVLHYEQVLVAGRHEGDARDIGGAP